MINSAEDSFTTEGVPVQLSSPSAPLAPFPSSKSLQFNSVETTSVY